MTNFEKFTKSPEALGAFLESIQAIDTPWSEAFHKEFCTWCRQENCEPTCPHQSKRDNPLWWLMQEAAPEQAEQ